MRQTDKSQQLFDRARQYLPGGVNSPVRAYRAVGGTPPFVTRGQGSQIYDADGNQYIDYVCSWGPLIHGHAHPQIIEAIIHAAHNGTSFGAPTESEVTLAEMVNKAMPSIEMVRFVNSGTEAAMSAIRLARAYTGRDHIIKFAGCYHGHSDGLLAKAGSGVATFGIPNSPGVPAGYTQTTHTLPYNDLKAVEQAFQLYPGMIAAIIMEPVAANMGVVCPEPGFLEGLRKVTTGNGSLLIFDEVITGFRLAYGGAQSVFKIRPDLTCLGKIIGGGLPVGAYGGRREIMQHLAPEGPVYQAGTLSGNPLAMAAGIAALRLLQESGIYEQLDQHSALLEQGILASAARHNIKIQVARAASLLTIFFNKMTVTEYDSARRSDTALFARFFNRLLEAGIYWPPSQFEAAFVSLAHTDEDILHTVDAIDRAFASL